MDQAWLEDKLVEISNRLARLEDASHGANAVYMGNNRVLMRLNLLRLIYFVEANDRILIPKFVMDGIYEGEITQFFINNIKETSHCIDVGANFGYYTCIMGKCAPQGKTIGIEADPTMFDFVRDNININWLSGSASALAAAAGDRDGEMTLYRRLDHSSNTSISRQSDEYLRDQLGEMPSQAFQIQSIRIDSLLDQMQGRVDFMKVDVEGAEPLVIEGARQTIENNPHLHLIMEWTPGSIHAAGFDISNFADDLSNMGFTPTYLPFDGSAPVELTWQQALNGAFPYTNLLLLGREAKRLG